MARLRGPGGCPWDREQTRATLRPYVLEEAYEVLEALDAGAPAKLREELGDLLFQVVLHAQIASERGEFDLAAVAAGIADKLVRRHPHVFGDGEARTSAEVIARWEDLKRAERAEKGEAPSVLSGVPASLPALARAQSIQERAARVGFDWTAKEDVLAKLDEERRELGEAIARGGAAEIEHEIGDVLFTVVNLARHVGMNAEDALRVAVSRFSRRFLHMERAAAERGHALKDLAPQRLEELWSEAKSAQG